MPDQRFEYDAWLDVGLRSVVRNALLCAREHGFPDRHHFYLSFRTSAPGVEISPHLSAMYPEEMTIVLQHQYSELEVEADYFTITLHFNKRPERLVIPFHAVLTFSDPSVDFALRFVYRFEEKGAVDEANIVETGSVVATLAEGEDGAAQEGVAGQGAKVVALDQFRKR